MKTWEEYSEDAMRTESKIDKVRLHPMFLLSVITVLKAAGGMLDQMKKHAYYDKEYDEDKMKDDFALIVGGLDGIKQSFSKLNDDQELGIDPRVFHAIIGIATESTELLEALNIHGENMDSVNLLEESFDVDWYQFILVNALGGDLENVWDTGIAKLKARYPDKFTNENATNRNLESERDILETVERTQPIIKAIL